MRDLFMMICAPGIWVIVALEILLLLLLVKEYKKNNKPITLCMSFIALGLIIDAIVIGMGAVLPEGILMPLSRVRFVAHGILIPLLFPICGYSLNAKQKLMDIIWIFTVAIMIAGAAEGFATDLQLAEIANVTRMLSGEGTPEWAGMITNLLSFGTVIPLIICGIIAWIKQKNPCLFLAGFFMFAFSALGPATGNTDLLFFISMIGEVLMVTSSQFNAEHTRISKKGSRYLRKTLYQIILPVIMYNPVFKEYYSLKLAQGKSHRCAQGHCIRKLLRLIFHLLTNDVVFDSALLR